MEQSVSEADGEKFMFLFFLFLLQLLELIAKSQLPSLSGVAQKNYMNILERVVQKGEPRHASGACTSAHLGLSGWGGTLVKNFAQANVRIYFPSLPFSVSFCICIS